MKSKPSRILTVINRGFNDEKVEKHTICRIT